MESTAQKIYKIYEERSRGGAREYLGMSQIGRPCERELWLTFRWVADVEFSGRMLRLFDTGHREEERVIFELREAGCSVLSIDPATKKQVSVQRHGGHFRGHVDGQVLGLAENPKVKHLMDVKTVKLKKFADLLEHKMKKAFPEYWAQAQCYMGELGLKHGVYIFVCKDDDRIHFEFFEFEPETHEFYMKRAEKIIFNDRLPPPISKNPTWYQCKMCSFHDFCHGSKIAKNANCRTCAHSTAERDGTWSCAKHEATIPDAAAQRAGCESHVIHIDLVPWNYTVDERFGVVWHTPEGDIANGEPDAHVYTSAEILANYKACAKNLVDEFRNEFDGRIVKDAP